MNLRNHYLALASTLVLITAAAAQAAPVPAQPATAAIPALATLHPEQELLLGITRAGSTLIAVGGNGVIARSTDGKDWKQVASPVDVTLTFVSFADAEHGWAVGHDAAILGTQDGGQSWTLQSLQPDIYSPLLGIKALDAQHAIAVGAFGLMKLTADGGKTWSDITAPDVQTQKFHINTVTRLANGTLLIAGEQGLLGISDDNGAGWKLVTSPYVGSYFGALPWGERGVIVYGMRGNVYVTDEINTPEWRKLDTGSTASLYGGQTLSGGRVLLTAGAGKLFVIEPSGDVRGLESGQSKNGEPSLLTAGIVVGNNLIVVGDNGALRMAAP